MGVMESGKVSKEKHFDVVNTSKIEYKVPGAKEKLDLEGFIRYSLGPDLIYTWEEDGKKITVDASGIDFTQTPKAGHYHVCHFGVRILVEQDGKVTEKKGMVKVPKPRQWFRDYKRQMKPMLPKQKALFRDSFLDTYLIHIKGTEDEYIVVQEEFPQVRESLVKTYKKGEEGKLIETGTVEYDPAVWPKEVTILDILEKPELEQQVREIYQIMENATDMPTSVMRTFFRKIGKLLYLIKDNDPYGFVYDAMGAHESGPWVSAHLYRQSIQWPLPKPLRVGWRSGMSGIQWGFGKWLKYIAATGDVPKFENFLYAPIDGKLTVKLQDFGLPTKRIPEVNGHAHMIREQIGHFLDSLNSPIEEVSVEKAKNFRYKEYLHPNKIIDVIAKRAFVGPLSAWFELWTLRHLVDLLDNDRELLRKMCDPLNHR